MHDDATLGRRNDHDAYEDSAQGRDAGHDPFADPTQGRQVGKTPYEAVTTQNRAVRQSGYAPAQLAATHAVAATEPGHGTRAVNGIEVTGRGKPALTRLTLATAIAGSLVYLLWAALHIQAGIAVATLGWGLHKSTMAQGRIYQDSFFLLFSAAGLIGVVLVSNWKASNWKGWKFCYWLALALVTATDVSFIIFILIPGYMKLWPGLEGP